MLVRIAASGANPHDTKSRSGWTGRPMRAAQVIPHADGSGIIVAVGPGVASGRLGQRVWIFRADLGRPGGGTAAEFATVASAHAVPLPADVDFFAGAVGQYAIQFARWSGARVVASASTPDKMAVARAIGANLAINPALTPAGALQSEAAP